MNTIGLEQIMIKDIFQIVREHIADRLAPIDEYFELKNIAIVGSRIKGTHNHVSDLDIAFEYRGAILSDSMCDILNGDEPLYIENIKVDFIPNSLEKGEKMIFNSHMISPISRKLINHIDRG